MELRQFVKETLSEILGAVSEAQHEGPFGFMIAPNAERNTIGPTSTIKFDVAITAERNHEGEAGAKIKVAIVDFNVGGSKSKREQVAHRVQFEVPIIYMSR